MPAKRPAHKKSVSFSDSLSKPSSEEGSFSIPFSIKVVPIHLAVLVYHLFTQDLTPKLMSSNLTTHIYLLLSAQLLYAVIFNSSILETRKSKQRKIKFTLAQDYSLIFISILICLIAVPAIYAVFVLLGAPFTTYIHENLLLAAHVSLLCFPVVVTSLKLATFHSSLYKYFIGIAVGAWLGAIAIPLDWDRPWQNWPLPIVGGAYAGAFVSYTIGSFV